MKKIFIICSIALIIVLLATAIFSTGCSCLLPSPMPYGPKVTGDGSGGAIAVYEDIRGGNQRDFYAQKISPEGKALWGETGVLIGSGYREADSFFDLHIVSDGSGGAIVTWVASTSSQHWQYLTHVTSVDSEGNVRWQKEVRAVAQMISDGAGGAIIATDYSYDGKTLFLIKIDSQGAFSWGGDGVWIRREGYEDNTLQLAGDGAGGAIIVWRELYEVTNRIFAQRINAEGNLSWGQEGVLLYTTPEDTYAEEPKVISDGLRGAIAIWMQTFSGIIENGSPKVVLNDIYAQRVDANGNILWQPNGVPMEITKLAAEAFPSNPLVISDNTGGTIIIWADMRHGLSSLYAQRIGSDGTVKWQPGGVEVCYIKTNASFWPQTAVSDGSGGAIIAYSYKEAETNKEGLLVQRLDAAGRAVWGNGVNGVVVTNNEHITHFISSDGQGGVIVAWGIGKGMFSSEKSYVQRIDSNGKLLWGAEGIRLNP